MAERANVRFREIQKPFPRLRKWVTWFMLGVWVISVGLAPIMFPRYAAAGDTASIIEDVAFIVVVPFFAVALTWFVRAETEVRDDGVYLLDEYPFKFLGTKIRLAGVASVEARPYRRSDYYLGRRRRRGNGKGYLLYGEKCVRIDYADGRHVVIGSQRPEELAEAIKELLKEKGER